MLLFLSQPFEYEQTTLVINVKGESFSAKGKIVKSKGWREISSSGDGEDKDQSLPPINKGEDVKLTSVRSVNEKTKPPARYNEATLLTAKWEKQLQLIGKGKANSMSFVKEMREYASKLVGNVVASTEAYKHDNATRVKCPDCGKNLLEVSGKRGKMLVCPDRDCGYRKGVSQMSNARCLLVTRRWRLEVMETIKYLFVVADTEKNYQPLTNVENQRRVP
ncbi:DNA topoisomerase [Clostridium estertheticum]|uniref:Topo IA-type catalytic domain-containing protein n=1 Tax=Clostridium estertheticum TaxID=238834 RepID=A0AA47EGE8_9CLOT|nr:DNA topoisomerase [Clostridium estertheticum]WAG59595.1 hypothetical protein LL038_18465 [Clostridium estertheticum]